MTKTISTKLIFISLIALCLSGCINVNQKTIIKEDLSGTILLHYWTNTNFVDIGDVDMGDDIGGFSFIDSQIKKKYSSAYTEITNTRRTKSNVDTTSHVELTISFLDINKLTEAIGFSNIQVSYLKGSDGMEFRYFIPKDTTISLNYTTDKNTLEYTFEFPGEIKSTNGTIETTVNEKGEKISNQVKWKSLVSEHATKDLEFKATIKNNFSICGMFGIELPVIFLLGMVVMNSKKIARFLK